MSSDLFAGRVGSVVRYREKAGGQQGWEKSGYGRSLRGANTNTADATYISAIWIIEGNVLLFHLSYLMIVITASDNT